MYSEKEDEILEKLIYEKKLYEEGKRTKAKEKISNAIKNGNFYKSINMILFSKHNISNSKYEALNITKMIYIKKTHLNSKYNEKLIDGDNKEYLKRYLNFN